MGCLSTLLTLVVAFFATRTSAKCPVGTVQGLSASDCFYYSLSTLSWLRAEEECVRLGGHLSSVHSGFANAFFSDLPNIESSASYWIGGSMGIDSVKWTWTDGSPFSYTSWASGEPTSSDGCLSLNVETGRWHSLDCIQTSAFICKIPPSLDPRDCSKCPIRYPCESGWTFFEDIGQCYKVIHGYDTWLNKENECRLLGAHLASIHSQEEEDFVQELAATGLEPADCGNGKCDNGVWIGLSAQQDINVFEWSDGTPVNYTHWTPGLSPHEWGAATFVDLFPDFFPDHSVYSHHWDNQMLGGFRLSRAAVCKKNARK